jgi:hypothetical protein
MAAVIPLPKFIAFADDGSLLAGGKLYTYAAGTSTPKTTWADAAETTPNANPVVLDSRGEALVYGSGSYKFVLTDSADVTIWTVDNVKIGGTVDTTDIVDGAITTPKLADGVLTADAAGRLKMADGYVTTAKLDTAGVTLPNNSAATTQTTGDNTTKVATTAFVQGEFTDKTASQAEMEAASSTTDFVTPGRTRFHPGVAKAWVRFTQSAGSVSVVASHNVSGVVRNGTGDYTISFSTSFSSGTAYTATGCSDSAVFVCPVTFNAGSCVIQTRGTGGGLNDPTAVYMTFFGDQ